MYREEVPEQLAGAGTQWAAVTALLRIWRRELPERPARHAHDSRWSDWADLAADVVDWFSAPVRESGDLSEDDRRRLTELVMDSPLGIDAVDAVAWGLDQVGSTSFAPAWRDEVCPRGELEHELADGEFYPVADPRWPLPEHGVLASRPSALTPATAGELPHVRVHSAGRFRIVASFRFERELEEVGARLASLAALHPHETIEEFEIGWPAADVAFPVRVAAPDPDRIAELVRRMLDADARIVVLPELSTDPATVDAIAAMLSDRDDQRLVVAGSYHDEASRRNVAVGLLPDCTERMEHAKVVPFSDDLGLRDRWREGIEPGDAITVHHADRFRFCLLTCKDFLSAEVRDVVDRVAANVLCVPAMSRKTDPFKARAAGHVADAQAVSVVANGPLRWADGARVEPAAVFGQPVRGRECVTPPAGSGVAAGSCSVLKIGDDHADTTTIISMTSP